MDELLEDQDLKRMREEVGEGTYHAWESNSIVFASAARESTKTEEELIRKGILDRYSAYKKDGKIMGDLGHAS